MADANQSAGNQSAGKGPVEGFDQTNGLAGNLDGDEQAAQADPDDDQMTDIGAIYTGHVGNDSPSDFETPDKEHNEEDSV